MRSKKSAGGASFAGGQYGGVRIIWVTEGAKRKKFLLVKEAYFMYGNT